jgi:hypothetical protein
MSGEEWEKKLEEATTPQQVQALLKSKPVGYKTGVRLGGMPDYLSPTDFHAKLMSGEEGK